MKDWEKRKAKHMKKIHELLVVCVQKYPNTNEKEICELFKDAGKEALKRNESALKKQIMNYSGLEI